DDRKLWRCLCAPRTLPDPSCARPDGAERGVDDRASPCAPRSRATPPGAFVVSWRDCDWRHHLGGNCAAFLGCCISGRVFLFRTCRFLGLHATSTSTVRYGCYRKQSSRIGG